MKTIELYKDLMIKQIDLLRDNAFIERGITHIGEHHNIEDEIEAIGDNNEQLYKLFLEIMNELSGLNDYEIKELYPPITN